MRKKREFNSYYHPLIKWYNNPNLENILSFMLHLKIVVKGEPRVRWKYLKRKSFILQDPHLEGIHKISFLPRGLLIPQNSP